MLVLKIMTQPVFRIDEISTIQDAIDEMSRHHIGSLIVTRNSQDVGILTERDIISKVFAPKRNVETVRVKEVMSSPLVTADLTTTGEDALRLMVHHGIRRLPITDHGKIVGIFTTSDVTKLAR